MIEETKATRKAPRLIKRVEGQYRTAMNVNHPRKPYSLYTENADGCIYYIQFSGRNGAPIGWLGVTLTNPTKLFGTISAPQAPDPLEVIDGVGHYAMKLDAFMGS